MAAAATDSVSPDITKAIKDIEQLTKDQHAFSKAMMKANIRMNVDNKLVQSSDKVAK